MTQPLTNFEQAILDHISAYAENLPQTCLDSPTARAMLAKHLAGNLAMRDMALAQELAEALKRIQKWLMETSPIVDDGITHPLFVKANNLTAKALAHARTEGVIR